MEFGSPEQRGCCLNKLPRAAAARGRLTVTVADSTPSHYQEAGIHLMYVALWLRILLIFCPQERRWLYPLPLTTSSHNRVCRDIS
ncbi:hypothetical protein CEXT_289211 [Caerostris extrusa]|uniref:Uncharacterized protein n=1 Tax=Caerostris extrusa TaxID=172846 RepID=A0AAV4RPC1_CAEEX|nr:hypothetical protein CEXT_289211 [Caerostris extrusa]